MRWYGLTELLPPIYKAIRSMFETADSENTELLNLKTVVSNVVNNFSIQTCDVDTLTYWETILHITPYDGEPIDERRQMILTQLSSRPVITEPFIKQRMVEIFGAENFTFEHDPNNNLIIRMIISRSSYDKIEQFKRWADLIFPAHIDWSLMQSYESNSTLYIAMNTLSQVSVTSTMSMTSGTETLYLGEDDYTLTWYEV